jgi:uncharacterized delta-60 repeat protein
MDRNTLWRLGVLLVSLCVGLTGCGKTTTTTIPPTAIAVKRYTATGQLDASFNGSGSAATKIDPSEFEFALAVALQSGKIIAAGHSIMNGRGVIALVRYNANGSLDTAFGSGGIVRTAVPSVDAVATAVVVQPGALPVDDKILVAGSTFNRSTGKTGIVLARYNTDGSLDMTFAVGQGFVSAEIGPGTDVDNASLALQSGSIVVAGATSTGNFVLRRYGSNGVLDQTFGTSGTATTHVGTSAMGPAIALQSDGSIVAAGASGSIESPPINEVLVHYTPNGTLDMTFGGGTGMVFTDIGSSNNFANALVVQPGALPVDDKIIVAGHAFVNIPADTSDITLIRYNADGTLDTGFGTNGAVITSLGGFDNAFSVALYPAPDNRIVVSGNTGSGNAVRAAVLRFTPAGALDPSFGTGGIVTTSPRGPSTLASANAVLIQPDGSIVVVGYD